MIPKFLLALLVLLLTSCSSLYYNAMEKIGKEKRDILVQRIVDGKKDQEAAKKQLKTTLEAFQELTGFEGGNLEKVYKKLNGEFVDSEKRAKDLSDRIASIDQVAKDLFTEWDTEISGMKDKSLRTRSQQMLRETRARHQQYIRRMQQTDKKMQPVLQGFRDQVLFLKHNLNAKAIGSLKTTAAKMDGEVGVLIQDIEGSMREADSFIDSLKTTES
ncbi:MAG: DUF2959 family protein [Acidobacteria bacterium]|nr:DUF2959 family protein [Acidobacteriota bacterium]